MPQRSNPDFDYWCDFDAPNITNTMTQLRELRLINNTMTNKGLHALLDKCPHLDLLDIRLCKKIRLDPEMKARLEWIKIVRLPHDPIMEYEFCKTEMRYQKCSDSNWSFWDWTEYDDSDGDYMYDDDYSPYDDSRLCSILLWCFIANWRVQDL